MLQKGNSGYVGTDAGIMADEVGRGERSILLDSLDSMNKVYVDGHYPRGKSRRGAGNLRISKMVQNKLGIGE